MTTIENDFAHRNAATQAELTETPKSTVREIPRGGQMVADLAHSLKQPKAESLRRNAIGFMPLRDQVLVRRVKEDEMSETGKLFIPEVGKEKPMEGEVIARGRGRFDRSGVFVPTELEPGDRILFNRYAGTEQKLLGEDVLLMSEMEVIGVLI